MLTIINKFQFPNINIYLFLDVLYAIQFYLHFDEHFFMNNCHSFVIRQRY